MDRKTLRRLFEDLPDLVSEGVISAEAAARIRDYYGEPEAAGVVARRWAVILFSILGATLIGGGIILLLAHNWDELSRPLRAAVSLAPLALSTALGAWVLGARPSSTGWKEGVGAFHTMAIGTAIALVSQTYHLGGRFDEFLLTWSLLTLPVAYLLGATFPVLFYLIGITVWTGSVTHRGDQPLAYLALLALMAPRLGWLAHTHRYHPRTALLFWALAATACIGTPMAIPWVMDAMEAWPVVMGSLFGVLYLAGVLWWNEAPAAWRRPLQTVGWLGTWGLSLALSFADPWFDIRTATPLEPASAAGGILQLVVATGLLLAALALGWMTWRRRAWAEAIPGSVPAVALAGMALASAGTAAGAAALFNLYLFAWGVGTIALGLRERRLAVVNAGMIVLASVILCRFFDADIGFVTRGLAFILIGAGFLATNLILIRRKAGVAE